MHGVIDFKYYFGNFQYLLLITPEQHYSPEKVIQQALRYQLISGYSFCQEKRLINPSTCTSIY